MMKVNKQNTDKTPGINCPGCNQFIETSIQELLAAGSLRCSHCNLQLMIDRQQSQTALKALEKVDTAQKRVEKSQKFNY